MAAPGHSLHVTVMVIFHSKLSRGLLLVHSLFHITTMRRSSLKIRAGSAVASLPSDRCANGGLSFVGPGKYFSDIKHMDFVPVKRLKWFLYPYVSNFANISQTGWCLVTKWLNFAISMLLEFPVCAFSLRAIRGGC